MSHSSLKHNKYQKIYSRTYINGEAKKFSWHKGSCVLQLSQSFLIQQLYINIVFLFICLFLLSGKSGKGAQASAIQSQWAGRLINKNKIKLKL